MAVDKKWGIPDANPPLQNSQPSNILGKWAVLALAVTSGAFYYLHVEHSRTMHASAPAHDDSHNHWRDLYRSFHSHSIPHGKEAEKIFLSVPNNDSAIGISRVLSESPHLAGSPRDFVTAKITLSNLISELGIEVPKVPPIFDAGSPDSQNAIRGLNRFSKPYAWIDTYYPVLNTPVDHKVQILDGDKVVWDAELEETPESGDPDAAKYASAVKAWHGLSKQGDVTGRLVYAKYGRKEDFDELAANGVDVKGAIVLARYGFVFRGLKVKAAQEAGAIGILIYSDTRDDGSVTVENGYKPYPEGPARNPNSVQRGSVQFISKYPGDPTTPGYPSYPNVTREEATSIPSIPSLPISWNNAKRLLEEIGEDSSSKRLVRLVNNVDDKVTPIWNTMAVIPGHIYDEVVVLGNHRDAWVMGAADPTSGSVSVHEIVRGLGQLIKKGWKPVRTIVVASWDAEEYGLVGSTEWGEDFADWIAQHVVAYVNIDVSTSGPRLKTLGSPSLAHLIRQTAEELPHPTDCGRTLWDARSDRGNLTGPADPEVLALYEADENTESSVGPDATNVGPLGSGSDYTVFLQRIGIASSDLGFGTTLSSPVYHYHSVYDSQRFQEIYADPGFHRHVAIAKHLGLIVLRLADSFILPLNTTQYSLQLDLYLDKVEEIASKEALTVDFSELREAISALQSASFALDEEKGAAERLLREILGRYRHHRGHTCARRHWRLFKDWVKRVFGVHSEPPTGHHRYSHASKKLVEAVKRVRAANKKLATFEQGFISEGGIKDREWYRHLVVAPGKWLGYGATTLPAVTEALEFEKSADLAKNEVDRLAELIKKLAQRVRG